MKSFMTRRAMLKTLGTGLTGTLLSGRLIGNGRKSTDEKNFTLFVGTYTGGKSEGIYRCRFEATTGGVNVEKVFPGIPNPSFLAIDKRKSLLYAVNEVGDYNGTASGSVSAFSIDPASRDLRHLNRQSSHGADPCYVSIDRTGSWVLVANYSGGSVTVLPVHDDGSLGEATDVIQHHGSGIAPRQQSPHAHSVTLDHQNQFAYVADLGIDKVMIYTFDAVRGKLLPAAPPWSELKPGAGPRHVALSEDGRGAYTANELGSTITRFSINHSTGALTQQQTLPTIPGNFKGENYPADIHLAPGGNAVYVSNRGHDSIAVFSIDGTNGMLSLAQVQPTGGSWPRNFAVDPTGKYLLAANQKSDTITVFSIDPVTGLLTPTSGQVEVPVPVCLAFL